MKQQILGTLGAIFTALCCIGTPALLALLTSIGAGFLINDLILLPLLVVFLGTTLWGLRRTQHTHGRRGPLVVATISSVVIVVAVWFAPLLVLLGLGGLMAATVWNICLQKASPQTASRAAP